MSIENIIALLAALGVGGLLGAFLNSYMEQRKQTKEHDIRVFKESNDLLNEQQLSDIMNHGLLGDYSIERENSAHLRHWEQYFAEVGHQYLETRLNKERKLLLSDVSELTMFIGQHFFQIRGQNKNNNRAYLYPDLNIDFGFPNPEERARFEKRADELVELCGKVKKRYAKYRLSIKQVLKI